MDLLSGLIGALIASTLSIIYLYFADKIKFRESVVLGVIDYVENIFHLFQTVHASKKLLIENKNLDINRNKIYDELTFLLKISSPHAKLRIAYGEDKEMLKLNFISNEIRNAALLLFNTTKENWSTNNSRIVSIIAKVEVQKDLLVRDLFDGLSIFEIINLKIFHIKKKLKFVKIENHSTVNKRCLQMRLNDINKLLNDNSNFLSDTKIKFLHEQVDLIIKTLSPSNQIIK